MGFDERISKDDSVSEFIGDASLVLWKGDKGIVSWETLRLSWLIPGMNNWVSSLLTHDPPRGEFKLARDANNYVIMKATHEISGRIKAFLYEGSTVLPRPNDASRDATVRKITLRVTL